MTRLTMNRPDALSCARLGALSCALLSAMLGLAACSGDDGATATDATASTSETGTTDGTTGGSATSTTEATGTATGTATAGTATTTAGTTEATTTTTTTTTTTGTTTGDPVACDPPDLPPEGSPCAMDGEYCSPGCEDPCQFCNLMMCEGGTWQPAEAFPAECLSCEEVCPAVVAAGCKGGPPDMEACVTGCMDNEAKCTIDYHVMLACIGPRPTFACDANALPTVAGCEDEFAELYVCIGI